ncbi:hypothetical protein NC796_08850 [Aliifodinibius sp. S!AR15-10]|uniref:hypothetical protein n=1 Tax=Aliifodinibius sp. S!AR15-10 TaxID=2950437 RepID=UPI00285629F8|nr:hypothetical protein [Aliifodinibius sp. S!AR15-10]MDR8391244.1 hypothetical protein [Aliifodinibius sp. S!AR15-10]
MWLSTAYPTHQTSWSLILTTLLTFSIFACHPSSADEVTEPSEGTGFPSNGFTRMVEYPIDGVRLGQGWHDDQGEKAQAVCIDFQSEMDDGQEQSMNMEVVTDRSEMMQSMNVTAEMQVKAIAYEVSGKASYAKNVEMKSENMNFVAHALVNNGVIFAAPSEQVENQAIALTPYFRNLASRNYPEFERQCGEAFVSAIYSGAELNAVLSFAEQSNSERESIEASMKGSGWGFEAEGAASQKMEQYSKSSELRISYYQTGGQGNPIPTDQQGFVEAINRLPQLAAEAGYNYRIMVQSYRSLPNFPGQRDEPDNIFREQLAVSYGRLLTIHDEITEILQDLDTNDEGWVFGPDMNGDSLRVLQDEIKTKLRAQRALARRCAFSDDEEVTEQAPCELPADLNTMNDYNYSILLPLPASMNDISDSGYVEHINPEIIDYRVRRVSEFRCEDDLDDPGCLMNHEIDKLFTSLNEKVSAE